MRFHESHFDVFFDDLDLFGILHNARYLLFMERCMGQFWNKLGWGGFDGDKDPDQFHLVRLNQVEYLSPFEGVGKVRVRLKVQHLGTTSLVIGFVVMPMDEDRILAQGKRVVVCVDPETRKKRAWSSDFKQRLAPYLEG
jgi:acyl-CoA thioester hydrolase